MEREKLIERLKAKGHEITEHNLMCEDFAVAMETIDPIGATELQGTICYEGSEPWLMAAIEDGKDPYATGERESSEKQKGHVN